MKIHVSVSGNQNKKTNKDGWYPIKLRTIEWISASNPESLHAKLVAIKSARSGIFTEREH